VSQRQARHSADYYDSGYDFRRYRRKYLSINDNEASENPCLTVSQGCGGELEEFGVLFRTSSAEERVRRTAGCPAEIVDEMRLIEVARGVSRSGEVGAGGPESHRASQPH